MLPRKTILFLLLSTLECLLLLLYRMVVNHSASYEFMILNLILAWIPIGLSSLFFHVATTNKKRNTLLLTLCFLVWLLFFPNAPYIVTDIVHLGKRDGTPIWFDLLLLESFGLTGFFLTYVSLFQIQTVFRKWVGQINARYISVALLYIASIGVSIGRFWRLNSWDALIAPGRVVTDVFSFSTSPEKLLETVSFSTFFFFLLITVYVFITVMGEKKSLS